MLNRDLFNNDTRFNFLSTKVIKIVDNLDGYLSGELGLEYNAKWRNNKEQGGYSFVFEVTRSKGRRKNLIILKPQKEYLKIEVYHNKNEKRLFNVITYEDVDKYQDLLKEIRIIYNKISDN